MSDSVVKIGVHGSKDFLKALKRTQIEGLSFKLTENESDVLVLELQQFSSFEQLGKFRETQSVPVLIVLNNYTELPECRRWLLPGDDFCTNAEFLETAAFRAVRLVETGISETMRETYRSLLETDSLTGLGNRRSGSETMQNWVADTSPDSPVSAIFLDLDHFKIVNDTHGHAAGDNVLIEVARILKPHISDEIHISRYGGEEILIAMKADTKRASNFAEFLRQEIEACSIHASSGESDERIFITASFGVASTDKPDEVSKLLQTADMFLYKAKSSGRNRVEAQFSGDDISDEDAMIQDFESRLKVMTDRLVEYISLIGRKLAGHYKNEADSDGMTGLYRKEYFTRRFEREFKNAQKESSPLTLLFLDIDDFGNVNRTYGYPTGDVTLKKVSAIMLDSIRSVDWTARYGGEELCIIMPFTPLVESLQVAERIRGQVEQLELIAYDGRRFGVTVSIGLAELSSRDSEPVDLVQRAGDQTRAAKKSGKNIVKY